METGASSLVVDYFDGRSARPRRVALQVADGQLHLQGDGVRLAIPLREVQWPERTRHGARIAHLESGGSLQTRDAEAWDAWAATVGRRDSALVLAQQSWSGLLLATLVLLAGIAAGYLWGLPWAARGVVALVPAAVDRSLGESVYRSLDGQMLQPSALPAAGQAELRRAFDRAVRRAYPAGAPAYRLHFHRSRLGPNAFALPGGTIVMTDELVKLVGDDTEALLGVLAHELGHVEQRHGMRMLVQAGVLAAVASLAFGDFSSWFATAPVLLGQAAYSREAEREADHASIRILQAADLSPLAMVRFFETLAKQEERDEDGSLGIAFSSHPADAERIRTFREAARR